MADYRDTLLLPFEKGMLDPPTEQGTWAVLNAQLLPPQDDWSTGALICEQAFRPDYLNLQNAGFRVEPVLELKKGLSGCLILASRSRAVNERNIVRAWNALKPGGVLVFAGDKNSGVQPMRKWVGARTEIAGSLSKHHAVAFWSLRGECGECGVGGEGGEDNSFQVPPAWPLADGYVTAPGVFSADGPDDGSKLLVEHFNQRIRGKVADFGAGWGFLADQLLSRSDAIDQLDLFEADWRALQAAKQNVTFDSATYHWTDLTREAPRGPYDWVIMNPPFHAGRAAEPGIGQQFIAAAAACLPSGGRLLMVANLNLPYERTLETLFAKVTPLDKRDGFKVLEAVKGSKRR